MTEDALLKGLRNGRNDAFQWLVNHYGDPIYNMCLGMVGDDDSAREMVQKTLIKVLDKVDDFDGRSKLSTWMHRIAVNQCLDHLRIRRREQGRLISIESVSEMDNRMMSFPSWTDTEQGRINALYQLIQELPANQRVALTLRHFQGMPISDIANVMECSVAAVDGLLFRGRQNLKRMIQETKDFRK